jgi:hypothetical protein
MQLKYLLITTAQGKTTLASVGNGAMLHALAEGDSVADVQELNITHEEFARLLQKAPTHHIKFDTMSGEITMTPKTKTDAEAHQ